MNVTLNRFSGLYECQFLAIQFGFLSCNAYNNVLYGIKLQKIAYQEIVYLLCRPTAVYDHINGDFFSSTRNCLPISKSMENTDEYRDFFGFQKITCLLKIPTWKKVKQDQNYDKYKIRYQSIFSQTIFCAFTNTNVKK